MAADKFDADAKWSDVLKFLEPEPPKFCPHEPFLKQKVFLRSEALEVLFGGRAAGGKELALDTPIVNKDGWTTMGELRVGQEVFGRDGQSTAVLAKSEVELVDGWRLEFEDGSVVEACSEHRWLTATDDEYTIKTTAEIVEGFTDADGKPQHRVPSTEAFTVHGIEYPSIEERFIIKADPIEGVPMQCIQVDNEDGIYLAGTGLVPTHNSDAILMSALQYVHVPGYAALIFRNTFSDLTLPGALMDRSHDWLDGVDGVRWNANTNTWKFPSSATITFGYLDRPDDIYRYKGSEVQFIGFDELTEIREKHYKYMFSRLRRPSGANGLSLAKVPLRVRSASNPAPNWVRRHFIEQTGNPNRIYIPSGVSDNPYVDTDAYIHSLEQVDPVERARLRDGDWYAEEAGSKFSKADFRIASPEEIPEEVFMNVVRYWDLASSEPTPAYPDPDWTAGALVSIVDGIMYILDMKHERFEAAGVEALVIRTAEQDGPLVKVRMEKEGGSSGKITIDHYSRHILLGYDFDGHPAIKDKETRMDLWSGKVKRGEVVLQRGAWNQEFLDEAGAFGAVQVHDDQLDAVSGAFEVLTGIGLGKQRTKVQIIV